MSQAQDLLNSLEYTSSAGQEYENSDYVVIDNDRQVYVPSTLRRIGVQHDHNIETLTFVCPRFWDGNDLSQMTIYINYMLPDGTRDRHPATNMELGDNTMRFDWTISNNVTRVKGTLSFLVCIVQVDSDGIEIHRWNSELNQECYISQGMECQDIGLTNYPDIITHLLLKMDEVNRIATPEAMQEYVNDWLDVNSSTLLPEVDAKLAMKADNLYYNPETSMLYLMSNGELVGDGVVVAAGGTGGGSSNNAVLSLQNKTGWTYKNISQSSNCKILFTWSSLEDGVSTGTGALIVKVGGVMRHSASINQGDIEIDVASYLSIGSNAVRVSVSDIYGNSRTIAFTINVISLTLTSSFDPAIAYTGAITFPYTPTGAVEKTVRFILDGVEIGHTVTSVTGRQQSFTIPAQKHGSHTLFVYFDANIDGETIPSNGLFYDIICLEEGNNAPVITSPFRTVETEQYVTIAIPYTVYTPQIMTAAITLWANGIQINELTVDRTQQTWTYRPDEAGELTLEIRCAYGDGKTVIKEFKMDVTETQVKVEAETEALALYLSSYGRSNNEGNPGIWEYKGVNAEFSNFNFVSDGWKQDEDSIDVLRVTGDARLFIPYQMFAEDFRNEGRTIEFELATRDVLNYSAEVISCYSGNRGYRITAQQLRLASARSVLGTRYKEDEHIRVTFTIEKLSENRLILCYINGIMSGAVQYSGDDVFTQTPPVGITIGSNECTTDIYNIRVYKNNLTRHQVLDNWIADTQKAEDRIARYIRNDVYDENSGQIVISKLPDDLCYMVIQAPELPQAKGDKKTCNGYFVDPQNSKRSFTWTNAEIDVQGTSSADYYRKNYKLKYKNGLVQSDENVETYQMNDNAVPTSTFTMKADVASSEGAFNVVLSMLYNELCPYKTPAQNADSKIRQTIEGFPMVIFWDNGTETTFLGKYNFNNDKGTPEVFGFKPGDESWEIRENGSARVGWHSADFSGDDWKTDFEARYPDKNTDITRLKALAEWLVSTDVDQATGDAITPVTYDGVEYTADTVEYRLAKFSAELSDHFIEEAIIFYYLFTEIFLSIDQREKNAFPTYLKDEDRWIVLFYDADSSCGTDNKGNMTFDYYLEDIDYTADGNPVYNGQNSVLWRNLRETRYNEIAKMYQDLRTDRLISYDSTIEKFENHQSKWTEAIFNEDMQIKCIDPLILSGTTLHIPMLQGKKEQWMKWWLYNRFRYLDSKYSTGTSEVKYVLIRAHNRANVHLTSYVNMYGRVKFNAAITEHRMTRGREYEFEWPASGAEDAVIDIFDADLLTSIGDLSPLMVELLDVSAAPHLTVVKLGDSAEDYVNGSLKSVTLGNNKLLRLLDVRNCTNLGKIDDEDDPDGSTVNSGISSEIDVSGCVNIEEIYAENTSLRSVKLPDGGVLKTLHLPGTINSLRVFNQPKLTDFVIPSYSQITDLRIENAGALDDIALDILDEMPAGSLVRIIGIDIPESTVEEAMALCDHLDTMRGVDENGMEVNTAQVSGRIYIPSLTSGQLHRIQSRYPNITVVYRELIPYTVRFWNGDTLLQTVTVSTGRAEYTGQTPVKTGETDWSSWQFTGWDPDPTSSFEDMDCYAQFEFVGKFARELVRRTLEGEYVNDRVTSVGDYAFYNVNKITSLSMPAVTSIGNYAFQSCDMLQYVTMPNVTALSQYAFHSCVALKEIVMPNLTSGIFTLTFTGCIELETVVLPSYNGSVGGTRAFSGCKKLRSIDYGGSPNHPGNSAYENCTSLEALILRGDGVALLNNTNAFTGTPIASGSGYIYVPRALVDSYKTATNWSTYADQIRAIEDYPEICGGEA